MISSLLYMWWFILMAKSSNDRAPWALWCMHLCQLAFESASAQLLIFSLLATEHSWSLRDNALKDQLYNIVTSINMLRSSSQLCTFTRFVHTFLNPLMGIIENDWAISSRIWGKFWMEYSRHRTAFIIVITIAIIVLSDEIHPLFPWHCTVNNNNDYLQLNF